jgi:hypothetical protein
MGVSSLDETDQEEVAAREHANRTAESAIVAARANPGRIARH